MCRNDRISLTLNVQKRLHFLDTKFAETTEFVWHWMCRNNWICLTLNVQKQLNLFDTECAETAEFVWHWMCRNERKQCCLFRWWRSILARTPLALTACRHSIIAQTSLTTTSSLGNTRHCTSTSLYPNTASQPLTKHNDCKPTCDRQFCSSDGAQSVLVKRWCVIEHSANRYVKDNVCHVCQLKCQGQCLPRSPAELWTIIHVLNPLQQGRQLGLALTPTPRIKFVSSICLLDKSFGFSLWCLTNVWADLIGSKF